MQTKNKVVKHLRGGDQLVLVSAGSGKQVVLPVVGVSEYDNEINMSSTERQRGPWAMVQTTYELLEPDGKGGQRTTVKKAGILYRANENVQVVV